MFRVIDNRLIDYGFQPIVNWLMRHPIDMSEFMLVGAGMMNVCASILMIMDSLLINVRWLAPQLVVSAIVIAILNSLNLYNRWKSYQYSRRWMAQGRGNPRRLFIYSRMMALMCCLFLAMLAMLLATYVMLFYFLMMLLFTVGEYFSACDLPPPKRQYQVVASGA